MMTGQTDDAARDDARGEYDLSTTNGRTQALVSSLIGAVITVMRAVVDAQTIGVPLVDGQVSADAALEDAALSDASLTLNRAWAEYNNIAHEIARVAAQHLGAVEVLPTSVYDASVQLASHQIEFEKCAHAHVDALEQVGELTANWRNLDKTSARTKVRVTERLVAGGMSESAATKAASGDDEYTSLKDRIADALTEKEEAERVAAEAAIVAQTAHEKMLTSRALLAALVNVEVAKRSKVTQTLTLQREREPQRESDSTEPRGIMPDGAPLVARAESRR